MLKPGGRLLLVDFAPHSEESLREQHAHRRLGFSTDDIAHWCDMAGLRAHEAVRLHGAPLTVVIWDCTLPHPTGSRMSPSILNHPGSTRFDVSFEFFPPKTKEMEAQLWRAVERLAPLSPAFVSVTYGAGGSTRERTHATVRRMLTETRCIRRAPHLRRRDPEEIVDVARDYWEAGVRHLVALRGDPAGR